jgi:hypothetical protein
LTQVLSRFEAPLKECLSALSPGRFTTRTFGEGDFSCRGIDAYRNPEEKAALLERNGIAVSVPTLAIAVDWRGGRFHSVIYLPVTMVGAPPLTVP